VSTRLQQLTESDPVTGTSGLTNTYSYGYDGLNRTSSITAKVNGTSTSPSYPMTGHLRTQASLVSCSTIHCATSARVML
jgi:hypothetical protein